MTHCAASCQLTAAGACMQGYECHVHRGCSTHPLMGRLWGPYSAPTYCRAEAKDGLFCQGTTLS